MSSHTLHHGDCLAVLRSMEADSVDAIVTDPPAGISFMGKEWDKDKGGRDAWVKWMTEVARECLRVIKPGGHALVWAIPRTSHWTGWAWEDAGWEPRDKIVHLFGSGFPKSLSVSKAIDKAAGAEREVLGSYKATGTARTINIDGCRIGTANDVPSVKAIRKTDYPQSYTGDGAGWGRTRGGHAGDTVDWQPYAGRWPANVLLDEEAAAMLDEQSPISGTPKSYAPQVRDSHEGGMFNLGVRRGGGQKGDVGGASRFFYTAKASRKERGEGNTHPTVKPLALMRWLVKLVCPPNGTVLDPFSGSGTTLLAAKAEGFNAIGIEREAEYVEIIKKRLAAMTPDWLREIESEMNPEPEAPDESPAPSSIDDLLGFSDE